MCSSCISRPYVKDNVAKTVFLKETVLCVLFGTSGVRKCQKQRTGF